MTKKDYCTNCWGTGKVSDFWDETKNIICPRCNGSGKEPQQTNEEWLRSCTTDEMVKTILDLCDYRPCFACGIGYCDDENWCHVYSDEAKEFVTEWLKQPHRGEP